MQCRLSDNEMMTSVAADQELQRLRSRIAELEAELQSRAEASLSEEGYRYAVELNPQVSWAATADGVIADFNQRWLDLTGLSREQALDEGWTQVPHPDDIPGMLKAWAHSIGTGEPFDLEHRIRVSSGEYRWMRSRAFPRRDSAGRIVRWYGTTEDIDERKKAELLLRNSEESFSAAFAEAPIGMVLTSPEGQILEINRAYREMLGYSMEDLAGRDSASITHPADVPATRDFFDKLRRGESSRAVIEKRYICRDGRTLWARASATMRRDAEGRPMQLVAIIEDITNRVEAEAERERLLHQVEAERKRLETVAAQMPSGLIMADAAGKLVFFNAEAERILGHPLIAGSSYKDYSQYGPVNQDGSPLSWEEYPIARALTQGETIRNQEMRYRKGDGTITTLEVSAAAISDSAGQTYGGVAVLGDVSQRKRMEEALRESEERLQLIFRQAPVAVCVLRGPAMVYELVNPHYEELLPGRELLGRPLLEVVPEASPALLSILNRVLETGEPFAANEFLVPLDRNRDGVLEDYWFNLVYHPLREPEGQVSGIVVVAVDVSSHIRARQQLQRANRELEEFAYVSSHDLQEPLRMVNIYTQLLMRDLENALTPQTHEFAAQVQGGVKRMEQLLKDLLNFSRNIASDHDEVPVGSLADLQSCAQQAIETLKSRIEEEGAVVTVESLPRVPGDEAQFVQVFQNLIANALKYRRAEQTPAIQISSRREGPEWVIGVRDNGIGFDQDYAERIFGLFKRLHRDEYPGTGLGLAICKRIVERHGGHIWAESAPQRGSTFFFRLREVADLREAADLRQVADVRQVSEA